MSTLTDEDTVVLEGLDFEIPCGAGGHAAHVSIACKHCGDQGFLCRDHWGKKRRRVDEYLRVHILGVVVCSVCKTQAWSVEDLVQVVPL